MNLNLRDLNNYDFSSLIKCLDKARIRIETNDKIPSKNGVKFFTGWKEQKEKRKIAFLLDKYEEYGLRTGTKLGNYWFCVLDLDKKGWTKIIRNKRISYIKTTKGFHLYLKIVSATPPPNGLLYKGEIHKDNKIGDFLGKGKQAVGVGSKNKQWIQRGKWFWILTIEELEEELNKWGVVLKFTEEEK